MCLQHCSWGQLLKGKILLQDKKREKKNKVTSVGITFQTLQLLTTPRHSYPRASEALEPQYPHRKVTAHVISAAFFWERRRGLRSREHNVSTEQPSADGGGRTARPAQTFWRQISANSSTGPRRTRLRFHTFKTRRSKKGRFFRYFCNALYNARVDIFIRNAIHASFAPTLKIKSVPHRSTLKSKKLSFPCSF